MKNEEDIMIFWIGIHDKANEGHFVYESDNSPLTWHNWLRVYLNDNLYCGVVRNDWNNEWDHQKCDERRSFACVRGNKLVKC